MLKKTIPQCCGMVFLFGSPQEVSCTCYTFIERFIRIINLKCAPFPPSYKALAGTCDHTMDSIQNPNPQQSSSLPQEPNQPKFGPPPQPNINLRTPESDLRSIQRGDALPVPESVLPSENPSEPVFRPETQVSGGGMHVGEEAQGGKKKFLLWVIVGIAVIIVGGAGYFVVYPLLFPSVEEPGNPAVTPPPLVTEPALHQTFFIGLPGATTEALLTDLTYSTVNANLASVAVFKQPSGTVQEVVVKDISGNQVAFKSFLNVFVPTLTAEALGSWFENDFTEFMYYDDAGAWPGTIAKVKPGANIEEARTAMTAIEGADLAKFYLLSPGVLDPFKDGKIKDYAARYAKGSAAGVSFNYGFGGNYFLLSTSYDGMKAAVALLGI